MSASRYCLGRLRGRDDIAAVPHFLMRGFRHRCIITHRDSGITQLEQLAGAIGMTGWQDSGNTWTRALLRRVGIGIDDAQWRVGRLTAAHPVADRLSGYGQPGRIEAVAGERPLVDLLRSGELEAVFTPFMPGELLRRGLGPAPAAAAVPPRRSGVLPRRGLRARHASAGHQAGHPARHPGSASP